MADPAGKLRCTLVCWGIAAAASILVAFLFRTLADMDWAGPIFLGVLLFAILAFILPILICRPLPSQDEVQTRHDAETAAARARATSGAVGAAALGGVAVAGASGSADGGDDAAAAQAQADAEAAAKAAADEAAAKAAADEAAAKAAADAAAAKATADAAAAKATADAAAAKAAADAKAASDAADAAKGADYDGDGVREGANEGTRPEALDGPRGGVADDLKKIKGVGPKMEKLCNSLGFYHFDQIASWSPDEVAWVDANLEGFKGRVTRDTWVQQAGLLASGGETAFSKKVDDGDVY